ncbi:MAG: carbon-nitrogen hydrolase family protein [Thermoleophilia bacterium]|nr:carbon-nitrogen hydrolase family protein [Thermoleophilia bacterium]
MRVACVQMNTRADVAANVAAATARVETAVSAGARLVALPETWAYKGPGAGIREHAEPLDGPSNGALAALAARHEVYILAGSHYETPPRESDTAHANAQAVTSEAAADRVYNTSVLFGPDGAARAVYRKIHLFDAVSDGRSYRESDDLLPGDALVTAEVDGFTVGLTICYDLRFPELYRALALRGAEVLLVPAAFTAFTGLAHWEVLLRARAIENGCFVVAPDQVGEHLPGRTCFGHSMIVDPWGAKLAEVESGEGVCVAELDLARLEDVRAQLPSLAGRRPDVYG